MIKNRACDKNNLGTIWLSVACLFCGAEDQGRVVSHMLDMFSTTELHT